MGGSIHIHGTASSIVDTVFVCRDRGRAEDQQLFTTAAELSALVASDLQQLAEAGRRPTKGDARCVLFGHLTRMAVWNLRSQWDRSLKPAAKLEIFSKAIARLADAEQVAATVTAAVTQTPPALAT